MGSFELLQVRFQMTCLFSFKLLHFSSKLLCYIVVEGEVQIKLVLKLCNLRMFCLQDSPRIEEGYKLHLIWSCQDPVS